MPTDPIEKAERVILSCTTPEQLRVARRFGALAVKASGRPINQMIIDGAVAFVAAGIAVMNSPYSDVRMLRSRADYTFTIPTPKEQAVC